MDCDTLQEYAVRNSEVNFPWFGNVIFSFLFFSETSRTVYSFFLSEIARQGLDQHSRSNEGWYSSIHKFCNTTAKEDTLK